MSIAFHHAALIVSDLDKAALIYEHILGLTRDKRPDLGFEGVFYCLGHGQQLHLMKLANPDDASVKPEHGGRYRHFALSTSNLDGIKAKLEQNNIAYTQSQSGRAAIFFYDFDGNAIELIQAE